MDGWMMEGERNIRYGLEGQDMEGFDCEDEQFVGV